MKKQSSQHKPDIIKLLEIKNLIGRSPFVEEEVNPSDNIGRIHIELESLNKKFDDLRDIVMGIKRKGDSARKMKVKREIILLLQKNGRMNPAVLGKHLGLSRVRANEYLKELEDDKITKSITVKKKKFYMLEDDLLHKRPSEIDLKPKLLLESEKSSQFQ